MGGGGHNVPLLKDAICRLTPDKCFNLHDSYTINFQMYDGALYRLAGNAVSLPVVELILSI